MKSQKIYMEHANMSVYNMDQAITFFKTAFPHFEVRYDRGSGNDRWVHIGDDYTYVALCQAVGQEKENELNYTRVGVNHLAFVVEDVDAIMERLLAAGYNRSYPKQFHEFRLRDYILDGEGNEFEFIQYLSKKVEERNAL